MVKGADSLMMDEDLDKILMKFQKRPPEERAEMYNRLMIRLNFLMGKKT